MSVAPLDFAARETAVAQINRVLDIRPLYDLLKQKIPEAAPLSLNVPFSVVDSSAFINTSLASLKNASYAFRKSVDWSNFISSRLRYVETGLMSVASLVHHAVFATIFSALSVVSFGQITAMNQLAVKHLIQTALAVGCIVTSVIGTLVPKLGIMTNLALAGGVGIILLQHAENEVSAAINDFYQQNREPLRTALLSCVGDDQRIFNEQIDPMLQHLERQLGSSRVRPLGGLINIFTDAYTNYPATGILAIGLATRAAQDFLGLSVSDPDGLYGQIVRGGWTL